MRLRADRIQEETGLSPVTRWQRLALIVAPAVMVLVAPGFHLGYPAVKGFSFSGGTHMRNPLISRYLNLTKNSSLAIAVGYMDIIATLGGNTLNQAGRALETILLQALGRQSDLLILKSMCVEFIRSVRPITLLIVASTPLNVFLPPGANFDLILRGIIMPQALKISIPSIVSTFIARVFLICCFSMSRYSMYPARTLQTGHR